METTINLRINIDLKLEIEELAMDNSQSLSEYIRDVLNDHIETDYDHDSEISEKIILTNNAPYPYEKSFDFTYLLTWLFCKQINPTDTSNKEILKAIKNKIELTIYESSFSNELKLEFVKVLNDINRFIVEPDYDHKQFTFCIPNNHLSFDYYKLMNQIWSIKH